MKHLTLNQSRVLSNPGVTTCLRAARHLAGLGLIEIKRELRGWYTGEVRALEFVVTERGRERLELAKSIRPYDRSRNQKVYERHERGESYTAIGLSLGIEASSARGLAATWKRYKDNENQDFSSGTNPA